MGIGDDSIGGNELLKLLRERLLRESSGPGAAVVNNVYGNNQGGGMAGGLMDKLGVEHGGGAGGISPEDMDYLVDIDRTDTRDPVTGEKTGWSKKVHRYAKKKRT